MKRQTETGEETTMREMMAYPVALVLKMTGFRFSKEYRWGVTRWHRLVYRCVSTVKANHLAGF